jgi:hypothetical protein
VSGEASRARLTSKERDSAIIGCRESAGDEDCVESDGRERPEFCSEESRLEKHELRVESAERERERERESLSEFWGFGD